MTKIKENGIATKEIAEAMKELAAYKEMVAQAKAEADRLQQIVEEYMESNGFEILETENHELRATRSEYITNRFDTTSFKRKYMELYNAFTVGKPATRFTIK